MFRTVLAGVLAVALLGLSLPAAEAVARDRAAGELRRGLASLADAADRLAARTDPVGSGSTAPRTTVSLTVPQDRLIGAGGVAVLGDCPTSTALCFRVGDGPMHGVRATVPLAVAGDNRTLGPGTHRVRLRHRRRPTGSVVVLAEV